jgi:membrane protease YdiL (CAAX protease family)
VVLVTFVVRHWKRTNTNPKKYFGLAIDRAGVIDFSVGTLIGTLAMLGTFYVQLNLGYLHVHGFSIAAYQTLAAILIYLASAFLEELISRGMVLTGLILVVGRRWLAVVLMAAIFGMLHGSNPHATALSIFSNALGGVVYAVAYLGSKRLWLGTGTHFAWNVVQGPILGLPVSGGLIPWGGLLSVSVAGPTWLTGGEYGPEGGLISVGFRFFELILLFLWLVRRPVALQANSA